LFDKLQPARVGTGGHAIGRLVARADHDANFLDACPDNFFDNDGQGGFGRAVAVHQSLEWQSPLVFSGGGNDSFDDLHGTALVVPQSFANQPPVVNADIPADEK
jgi:hypothetical protein